MKRFGSIVLFLIIFFYQSNLFSKQTYIAHAGGSYDGLIYTNSINAIKHITKDIKKGEQIAVFSSGGTISSIIGDVLKLNNELVVADLNFSVRNTSFSTLLYSNNETNLLTFNELPHLKDDMITFV